MGVVVSAISKWVERVKVVAEGVKSVVSHGASALGCLRKGDMPGAMSQVQAGCKGCLTVTGLTGVPGLTFKSIGSKTAAVGFNPWRLLSSGSGRQTLPTPPMGLLGLRGLGGRVGASSVMTRGLELLSGLPTCMPAVEWHAQGQPVRYATRVCGRYAVDAWHACRAAVLRQRKAKSQRPTAMPWTAVPSQFALPA
jgi:hypothetical protein